MDEQQMIQLLNQIPLDVLQNYVAQRTQQEQAAMQQMPQTAPMQEQMPEETYAPAPMSYGGKLNGWSPEIDMYACGGSTRTAATRGRLGARKGHRK